MTVSASAPPPQAMPENNTSVYADYQATTPVDPRVRDAMWPFFGEAFGNPHSMDNLRGKRAEDAVELARHQVALSIGAEAREIVFTSGATEANNLAIAGAAAFHLDEGKGDRRHIITLTTEHMSVLSPIKELRRKGFEVTVLPVKKDGLLDIGVFKAALRNDTLLVSMMAVNNEIGVIQDIATIGALCREKGALLHVDAAQALGRISLDVKQANIDLLSLSAHKIYGPMGIGALYIRRKPRVRIMPQLLGGGQQSGIRSGTIPLPLAVGFGLAAEIANHEGAEEEKRILALRKRFLQKLALIAQRYIINGSLESRIACNINLCFRDGDIFHKLEGVCASRGSACSSGGVASSHVIRALGVQEEIANTAIRFSFGRFTTEGEIDYIANQLISILNKNQ